MKFLLMLTLTMVSTATWAIPRAPFNALEVAPNKSKNSMTRLEYDFEGIIKLSNCSGSIIAFNGQPMTAKAIVMTNGHCVQKPGGFLAPGEVWLNRPAARTMKVFDRNMKLSTVKATKVLYATMTNTDVTFYELDQSYADIMKTYNVRPLLLDGVHPLAGSRIEIISGYWDRGYKCEIDGFVHSIREADWTWFDSIRYTAGCDTIGGTSGSPILASGERRVVGINNTSNEDGQRCTMNNPCEVDAAGKVTVSKGVRYGEQTFNVYSCLTPDFRFDPTRTGCTLPH